MGGGVTGNNHTITIADKEELFSRACSTENLFLAWQKFRRGKRAKADVMTFARYIEQNLFEICDELASDSYIHGPYVPFTVHDPKKRNIHKAVVKDRIVHQAVVNSIEPIFEKQFIHDSFSCRVDKGTHAAVKRLRTFLRQASANTTRTVYALKCDVRKFFDSVDHGVLMQLVCRRVHDDGILKLLGKIIDSFSTCPGKGIPLGNLTSQLFANIYLHELDRFMKHTIRAQWYVRYCDDFVVVHQSREYLVSLVSIIEKFLQDTLALALHEGKSIVKSWGQGIDFLGYVLLPHCTILRKKTEHRIWKRLAVWDKVDFSMVESYLGLLGHCNSFNTRKAVRRTTSYDECWKYGIMFPR